ncbi:E3 SUMO-protein ligase ZBED1-like isoform X1 [Brienomyrus brachyistius]|uniref:E3 SUMO-protein ligase ZBED1-like isoform X1 n=1 Tax=Brienomyrus brachyistius TaxID=42636 RepID=UPI0020B280D2|nr:E3 SUMO-protein ligase ZBED1-like isoform X1 [Brienomyrus brachyistius]
MDKLHPAPSNLKSTVWQHFGFCEDKEKGVVDKSHTVCKVCRAKFKYFGNTTNMKKHITRFHSELQERTSVPIASSAGFTQRTLEQVAKLPSNSEKAKRITRSVAGFIAKDLRPYCVVENEGFRSMLQVLEPRYSVPSRRYFSDTAIPALYRETKAQILESISNTYRIAITCDAWTSISTDSYVTITALYITDEFKLTACVLQTRAMNESHTGTNVAELLQSVANEWKIANKNLVLVTDNASNMAIAAQLSKFPHVRCYAHTLNLASQRALKLPAVSRLLGRVRRIVTFFHRSTTAKHQLEEKQKQLNLPSHKLKSDVITRWNSAYEMLERFIEQQPAVCAALLSPEVRKGASEIFSLTESDISCAEDVVNALKPMKDATLLMSEESSPTACLIAPLHAKLIQDMKENTEEKTVIREIKRVISEDLSRRYTTVQETNLLHKCASLDPRFKALPFLSKEKREEAYKTVTTEASSLQEEDKAKEQENPEDSTVTEASNSVSPQPKVAENQDDRPSTSTGRASSLLQCLLGQTFSDASVTPHHQSAHAIAEEEMTRYLGSPPLSLSEDPLNWWHVNKVSFPLLSKMAKRYLCIPATSVSAERVFSTAGDIVTAQRSTLTPEHVDQLLFLHKNLNLAI